MVEGVHACRARRGLGGSLQAARAQPGRDLLEIGRRQHLVQGVLALHAVAAEDALRGQAPSDEVFSAAAELAAEAAQPEDNVRGTAEWKRQVVRVYTRRALAAAAAQAQG